jgi:hypothetical protein
MSWLEYMFDSNWKQRRDLNRQGEWMSRVAASDRNRANELEARVKKLESENAELNVVCRALLQTLIDRDLMTKESFIQLTQQIEAENRQQYGRNESGILPKPEPLNRPVRIDFSSARQKPESFNG